MGNLIWHDLGRLVAVTASIYTIWSAFYGFYFRKFFWDFVGGTLRAPGGLQPAPGISVFITLIVKTPIVQVAAMILGFILLAIEYPLPQIKHTSIHRSFAVRIVLLFFQAFLTILYYQGTNACIYSLVAIICYTRANMLGEVMEEAKENRGKVGRA